MRADRNLFVLVVRFELKREQRTICVDDPRAADDLTANGSGRRVLDIDDDTDRTFTRLQQ